MAYEILTESYGRRLPKITAEADSTDDLATLGTNYAEGSTCVIGDKTYSLDKVQGWVEAGSGGGGGGGGGLVVTFTLNSAGTEVTSDKTYAEIMAAIAAKDPITAYFVNEQYNTVGTMLLTDSAADNATFALYLLSGVGNYFDYYRVYVTEDNFGYAYFGYTLTPAT